MSARIAKLESLLSRVQERAASPRTSSGLSSRQEADHLELDDPDQLTSAADRGIDLDELELDGPGDTSPVAVAPQLDELDDVVIDDLDEVDLDEVGPPESGEVSGDMEAAMAAAAEAPPLTPPPESGEDVASPHIPAHDGPTMGQLGETIQLDEGKTQSLELDEPIAERGASASDSSGPSAKVSLPENAREDLERVRLGEAPPVEARVSKRPVLSTSAVEFVSSAKEFEPESFLALVDASLSLK